MWFSFLIEFSDINKILAIESRIFQIGFEDEDFDSTAKWDLTPSSEELGYNFKLIQEADDDEIEDNSDFGNEWPISKIVYIFIHNYY